MTVPRRFHPPTSLLRAFEAAARAQSFTLAARELNLTQSAVSRQIRALEDMLGAALFHREKQKVRLTLAGAAYARDVREALTRISGATLGFRANPTGGSLHLAVLPLFAARWLIPRLPRFATAHPDITINLATRLAPFAFQDDTIDAAVHFGLPDWPATEAVRLMSETVLPVCTPSLKAQLGLSSAADLVAAPLLHMTSRPDAWERWFRVMTVDPGEVRGTLLDQFALVLEMARAGVGVGLLPEFLIANELSRGELVAAGPASLMSDESYHLVWPRTHGSRRPLEAFRNWISAEVGVFVAAQQI